MRPDSITLAIFEKYTPEEMATTAGALVQALADKETAETEKKLSDSVFKERISKHDAEAAEHAKRYAKGGETAQIGCSIRYDVPTVGKKSYIRMDREEVVEVHDMSPEERQQTMQFPLTASEEPKQDAPAPEKTPKRKPKDDSTPTPETTQTVEITFKDIQAIAANIAELPAEHRAPAQAEMQKKIANGMFAQKGCIGPDGRVETIDSMATADSFAEAWLKTAIEKELAPPPDVEVTRLCPYPGCIGWDQHEGDHIFPKPAAEVKTDSAAPEPQREPEKKPRKKRNAPPMEPPCQEPPQPPAGND